MQEFEELKQLITLADPDVEKFDAGNKAAGVRVRKHMQTIKKQCQVVRDRVLQARE